MSEYEEVRLIGGPCDGQVVSVKKSIQELKVHKIDKPPVKLNEIVPVEFSHEVYNRRFICDTNGDEIVLFVHSSINLAEFQLMGRLLEVYPSIKNGNTDIESVFLAMMKILNTKWIMEVTPVTEQVKDLEWLIMKLMADYEYRVKKMSLKIDK